MLGRMARIALVVAGMLPACHARAEPDAASLLFEEPQLSSTRPGDVLAYSYSRTSKDTAQFGASFDDTVRLMVTEGSSDATRNIEAELFSGERRRPAGPFHDMTGNPLLSLMLEDNIQFLSAALGGNPRYFKTAVRTALRDAATVVAETVSVDGHDLPGWRVTITPFKDGPDKARMKGLDALAYRFDVAPAVPGEIVQIDISARSGSGDLLVEENVTYVAPKH